MSKASPKKNKRRLRPGTRALMNIRREQKGYDVVVSKLSFARYVKLVMVKIHGAKKAESYRIQSQALNIMMESMQEYFINVAELANLNSIHAKRVTLMVKDFRLAERALGFCRGKQPIGNNLRYSANCISYKRSMFKPQASGKWARPASKRAMTRMLRRAGVKRVQALSLGNASNQSNVYNILSKFVCNLVNYSTMYMEHTRRKTITTNDVIHALKFMGVTYYGVGPEARRKIRKSPIKSPSFKIGDIVKFKINNTLKSGVVLKFYKAKQGKHKGKNMVQLRGDKLDPFFKQAAIANYRRSILRSKVISFKSASPKKSKKKLSPSEKQSPPKKKQSPTKIDSIFKVNGKITFKNIYSQKVFTGVIKKLYPSILTVESKRAFPDNKNNQGPVHQENVRSYDGNNISPPLAPVKSPPRKRIKAPGQIAYSKGGKSNYSFSEDDDREDKNYKLLIKAYRKLVEDKNPGVKWQPSRGDGDCLWHTLYQMFWSKYDSAITLKDAMKKKYKDCKREIESSREGWAGTDCIYGFERENKVHIVTVTTGKTRYSEAKIRFSNNFEKKNFNKRYLLFNWATKNRPNGYHWDGMNNKVKLPEYEIKFKQWGKLFDMGESTRRTKIFDEMKSNFTEYKNMSDKGIMNAHPNDYLYALYTEHFNNNKTKLLGFFFVRKSGKILKILSLASTDKQKGTCKKMLTLFIDYLKRGLYVTYNKGFDFLILDIKRDKYFQYAKRCYESVGFKSVGPIGKTKYLRMERKI